MSIHSIKFWDQEPTFRDDVTDADAHLLRRTVHRMLLKLWPASATWQVQYHPGHYVLGCKVPSDVKITYEMVGAGTEISANTESWVEWSKGQFLLCSKVIKESSSTTGTKRKRG
jgi:hypothetical protein